MVLTIAYQLVFVGSINTAVAGMLPDTAQQGQIGLTLPISTSVSGLLAVVSILFGTYILLVATRLLVRDSSELSSLPSELFTHRVGRALLAAIVANVLVSIAVTLGLIALVIPGLFLSVSFTFVFFAIGVEDQGPVDALRRSWDLATGNRWRLFGLVLIVGIVAGAVGGLSSLVTIAGPAIGQIVVLSIISIITIVNYGILADAFVQLRTEAASEPKIQ
ncbi:conserved hypothetical protein [Halomicrobium mukohataei DSM 12286]|uniref:DUF7847 domain-containing protein n=2 Tax=Halomicrobium mukohataei TaxID=57705 RepID=C7NW74_HALMD|nr:conserved hypothetical protein [Halomicrobium mukohataei DSM 12286]